MDYTMDTLSMGDDRVCEGKCLIQGSSYEDVSVEHRLQFIHRSHNHKEVRLLGVTSPLNTTHSSASELKIVGQDSVLHGGYVFESNISAEDVYEVKDDSSTHFMRSYAYNDDNKISRNEDEILKQRMTDRLSSFYCNEDRLVPENMCADQGDCLERSLNSVNDMQSIGTLGLEKVGKIVASGDGSFAVSDFLPSAPQGKEEDHCVATPLERNFQYRETLQDKHFQFPHEDNSGYAELISQQSHFVEMNFQRADNFVPVEDISNTHYQESSTHEEVCCRNMDIVDVSQKVNIDIEFVSASKSSDRNVSSVTADSDFSDTGKNTRTVSVLTPLQDEKMVAALEGEHNSGMDMDENILQSYADLADQGSGYQHGSKQVYLSKSNDLIHLNFQLDNANTARTIQNKHEFKSKHKYNKLVEDDVKTSVSEISETSVIAKLREDTRDNTCDENIKSNNVEGNSINCDNKKINVLSDELETDDDLETTIDTSGELLSINKCSLTEDHSIRSPPSPLIGTRRKLMCNFCNKSWKLRKDLNKHLKTHTGKKKYVCSVCNSSFRKRTILKKHLEMHSDVKLFSCTECPTTCYSMDDLRHHQRKHTKVRTYSCPDCSYTAKRQKHLNKHMLVHATIKIYNCQFCKFSSKRNYSLQRHMKTTHSTVKILECTSCSFKSCAVDSFKLHVAMHAAERTTSCIVCQAVIKKRPKMIKHLISHCSDQNNTCKNCDKMFVTGYAFILHLLSHKNSPFSGHDEGNCSSVLDHGTPLLNGNVDATSGIFEFLTSKSQIVMDTPSMEAKLLQMSTITSRLTDMTKVVTLLNEKPKVVLQLSEISSLATELALISANVLQSYKNTYGVKDDTVSSKTKAPSTSNDGIEDSSLADDDFEMSPVANMSASKIKEEFQDCVYPSTEPEMQIQVDFEGEPVSCIQKDDSFRLENSSKSKGDKHLKCARCNLTFTDSRSLKRHLMAHDDVRPYSCEKCGQSFRRNEHLKKHMVTHSDERPFVCKECPYAAKTEHRLKIHMLCHSQTKAFACQHCTYTARTNYELNHHMKRHEPRVCSQCSFVCYSRAELKKHVFTHSSFDCNECEFTTSDRAEYTKHIKRHSLVQHLCCELCGYSCDTMKKFKYHKLRHDNKTPYECPDCDYKCSSRASYDCHRLKHAGLKPYLCSFCGAAFRKTSHLNQHLLIHKDEKAFKCEVCGYSCRTKHNLKEHEMTHSGEKPFACRYCSFSCRRNKALQLHMLKHESPTMMIPSLHMPTMNVSHLRLPIQMPIISSGP